MTISANGVTQYSPDEMIFTPIEQWEREYIFYLKLLKVYVISLSFIPFIKIFSNIFIILFYFQLRTFVIFRMWKAFYIWKKSVTYKKFISAKNFINDNLFITDAILSKALLEIKSMCSIFLDSSFFDNNFFEKILLFYFAEKQVKKLYLYKREITVYVVLV